MEENQQIDPAPRPKLTRRNLLKAVGLMAVGKALKITGDAVAVAPMAREALTSRELPKILDNPDLADFELDPHDVEEMWHKHMEKRVDEYDKMPITTLSAWKTQMYWFNKVCSVQFNQKDLKTRGKYSEFVDNTVENVFTLCDQTELHPSIFFETYLVSGQNIAGLQNQKADVGLSTIQVAVNTLEIVLGTQGPEVTEFIQRQLSNPYSPIFQNRFRTSIETEAKKYGLASGGTGFGQEIKASEPINTLRMPSPTMGMMDMEPVIYAEALEHTKFVNPELFSSYPDISQKLSQLSLKKSELENARVQLKISAEELLEAHPDLLHDFFDPKQAEQLLEKIGIGEMAFGYTVDTMQAAIWDYGYFEEVARGVRQDGSTPEIGRKGSENVIPPKEKFDQQRFTYTLNGTLRYYQDLYKKNPDQAQKLLLQDQIFKPKFQAYLNEHARDGHMTKLNDGLTNFERAAQELKDARMATYAPLFKHEYDTNFQMALGIAVTKKLLDDVVQNLPEYAGSDWNSIYWQSYLITLVRECAPFPQMLGSYLRPDVDGVYNTPKVLKAFEEYKATYRNVGLIKDEEIHDFTTFSTIEYNYYKSLFPQNKIDGFSDDQKEILLKSLVEYVGYSIYSSWQRAFHVGEHFGVSK